MKPAILLLSSIPEAFYTKPVLNITTLVKKIHFPNDENLSHSCFKVESRLGADYSKNRPPCVNRGGNMGPRLN
jgi:hypothetical protein